MKKVLLLVLSVIFVLSFVACSQPEEAPAPEPTHVVSTEETPAPEQTEEAPTEQPIPEDASPTTGLPGNTTYKPLLVQIGNDGHERPQVNIQLADVVYETPIEGTGTRFTALYNDALFTGDPTSIEVGPIRSSRYYHQWIQGEWDGIYIHMGGPDATSNPESDIWKESDEHIKIRINGAGSHAENAGEFYPLYDGYTQSEYAGINLIESLEIYNYEPVQLQQFKFYPLEDYADEQAIESVSVPFLNSEGWLEYKYDATTDKLTRYMNGEEHVDRATGEPIEVQNLIVQFTTVTDMPNDPGHRQVDVIGEGPAEFFIHGKRLVGTWSRPSSTDKTTYTLENGEELTLTPGNTWIAVHPNTKEVVTTYADGTEVSSHA